MDMRSKLDAAGIGISALGSPLGKIKIDDDFEAHKIKLRRTCEIAKILGADRIRMFSFFIPKGTEDYSVYRDEVMRRLGEMIDIAEEYDILLCHENEKGIYGDTPERCLDIQKTFPGRIGCVFDTANFLQVGATPFPDGFMLLRDYITYMHVKDCAANGTVVVAASARVPGPERVGGGREDAHPEFRLRQQRRGLCRRGERRAHVHAPHGDPALRIHHSEKGV